MSPDTRFPRGLWEQFKVICDRVGWGLNPTSHPVLLEHLNLLFDLLINQVENKTLMSNSMKKHVS